MKRYQINTLNNDIIDTKTMTGYCDNQSICELLNWYEEQLNKFPPKIREVWLNE